MKNYRVKLKFMYSDVVHVKAENPEEAQEKALAECDEVYDCFYDVEISEE